MSDIKRLVSAATAQWLPVALGGGGVLAVPSGGPSTSESHRSHRPHQACVKHGECHRMPSAVGTVMKGTPLGSHKSPFLPRLLGF